MAKKNNIETKLKEYLNHEEANDFLWLLITSAYMKQYRENLSKFGNITKDEHKNLKTSEAFLRKFVESVLLRLNEKSKQIMVEKTKKYEIKIIDYYTKQRLYGEWGKEIQIVKMPRDKFESWCDHILQADCNFCEKSCNDCEIYDLFQENMVPTFEGWDLPNCPYAHRIVRKPVAVEDKESEDKDIPEGKKKLIVMRFVPKGIDISNPEETLIFISKHLAPSRELLARYKKSKDWDSFKKSFINEANNNLTAKLHLDIIKDRLSKDEDVYIICCEKDNLHCRRSIIGEILQEEGFEWREF